MILDNFNIVHREMLGRRYGLLKLFSLITLFVFTTCLSLWMINHRNDSSESRFMPQNPRKIKVWENSNTNFEIAIEKQVQAVDLQINEPMVKKKQQLIKGCKDNKCNFVFIKTMKCATETVVRILRKYSYENNLNIMLPRNKRLYLSWPFLMDDSDFRLSDKPFNGLIDHAIYNKTIMNRYFPPQTTHYVTIIREPLKHFKSTFSYFRYEQIAGIFAKNPLTEYLENIEHYDAIYKSHEAAHYRYCIPDGFSATKNFIAHCLGMPLGFPKRRPNISNDLAAIKQYINDLDKEFSLVMIVEYFHESLILFKRLMNWKMKDIIYKHANRGTYYFSFNQHYKAKHRKWTPIDYMLYEHFNNTLWKKIAAEGPDFHKEVKQFSQIQHQVNHFCWGIPKNRAGKLEIQPSSFNLYFNITGLDCESLDITWLKKIKAKFDQDNSHVIDRRPKLRKKTC